MNKRERRYQRYTYQMHKAKWPCSRELWGLRRTMVRRYGCGPTMLKGLKQHHMLKFLYY